MHFILFRLNNEICAMREKIARRKKAVKKYISFFSGTLFIRFICLAAHYEMANICICDAMFKIWNSSVLTKLTPGLSGMGELKQRDEWKERTFYFISSFPSGVGRMNWELKIRAQQTKNLNLYIWRIEYISIYTIWFDAEYCVVTLRSYSSGNGYDIRKMCKKNENF